MSVQLPLIFTAWGFRKGGDKWRDAADLAVYCTTHGIRSVAVQLGYTDDGFPTCHADEAEVLRDAGLQVIVWGVADAAFAAGELQRLGATQDEWLPQIEGPGQRDLVLDAAARGLRPAGIVTNYSGAGDSPGEAAMLRDAGVRCVLVECYNDAGIIEPYTDLYRMIWQGTAYGWRTTELVATMGTYHGEQPVDYTGADSIGRDFGLYLAEPMSSEQWTAFGALNMSTPPTPEEDMDPITDTQARESVKTVTQAAMSAYADPKPRGRNTIAWRIANADDTSWNAARDKVVTALNDAGVPDVPA